MDKGPRESKRLRVYENWQGNEVFFCYGYLVGGPNWKATFGSAALIVCPTVIFLTFVSPYLTFQLNAAIMVFSCLLPTLCIVFLFMTACRDPGIIPREEPDEEFLAGRKPRTKEVVVNDQRVVIRYNDTCHFYQPPRAHHCSVNDNCIERFDHHCPWVGTTIGQRNYRTFLLFVFSSTVLCLYVIGCGIAQLFIRHNQLVAEGNNDPWNQTLIDVVPALCLIGFCFLFLLFVGGLSGFHCYLVSTNQTTYENFRYNSDERRNPYDKGILGNCFEVMCMPIPPSKIDFRAFVDEVQAANRQQQQTGRAEDTSGDGVATSQQHQELTHLHEQLAKGSVPMSQAQARSLHAIQDRYSSTYHDNNDYHQQYDHQPEVPSMTGGGEGSRATSSLDPSMSASPSAYFTPGGSQDMPPAAQGSARMAFNSGSPAQMGQSFSQRSLSYAATAASGQEAHNSPQGQERFIPQRSLLVSAQQTSGGGADDGVQRQQQARSGVTVSVGALAAAAAASRTSHGDPKPCSSQELDSMGVNSSSSAGRVGRGVGSLDTQQASPPASNTTVYGPGPV
ncbi:hypothetical protein CEUSTIGMA_g8505.t1 [Chlamydomonas eustigma]|uniref:S-acyltransferase n=1 Tax=Chlamydomonas eustigma TaxID=1157962 RepID=A0A250XE80_9CHLO|nr:hypothetical protein CEUSTIGMA_g8505.t1 [Chlamydomonas eustigma]|eukprot:GAX81070.1 hypothetical protein CEUSTIGMA_g8505.t1 [Chlamydomonas eustigma]